MMIMYLCFFFVPSLLMDQLDQISSPTHKNVGDIAWPKVDKITVFFQ